MSLRSSSGACPLSRSRSTPPPQAVSVPISSAGIGLTPCSSAISVPQSANSARPKASAILSTAIACPGKGPTTSAASALATITSR